MALQHRRKYCYFKENGITEIDYKDVKLLRRFINDQGKIMPRRVTGTSAKMHRKVVRAIIKPKLDAIKPIRPLRFKKGITDIGEFEIF